MRVALQLLLNLKRQSLHAAPHVRMARRDPNPNVARNGDHARSAFNVAATSAEGASAADPHAGVVHFDHNDVRIAPRPPPDA